MQYWRTSGLTIGLIFITSFVHSARAGLSQTDVWDKPVAAFQSDRQLSNLLLKVGEASKMNVLVNATDEQKSGDATTFAQTTVGAFLTKETAKNGFFWIQLEPNTILAWPNPDLSSLAKDLISGWDKQKAALPQDVVVPPKVGEFAHAQAQLKHLEGGEEKWKQPITFEKKWGDLPPELQNKLKTLLQFSTQKRALKISSHWLADDFWQRAVIKITKNNGNEEWWITGNTGTDYRSSHMIMPPFPPSDTPIPAAQEANSIIARDGRRENLDNRLEGVPSEKARDTKIRSIKEERIPLALLFQRIQEKTGIPVKSDEETERWLQDKLISLHIDEIELLPLLKQIAFLYDLRWSVTPQDSFVAKRNPMNLQNTISKIGSGLSLASWERMEITARPDWKREISNAVPADKLRNKDGFPFTSLPKETQDSLRWFNQASEALYVLSRVNKLVSPELEGIKITWQLYPVSFRKKEGVEVPKDFKPRQATWAELAQYFDLSRPFTISVTDGESNEQFTFHPGLKFEVK